jgi:hypothetical protein
MWRKSAASRLQQQVVDVQRLEKVWLGVRDDFRNWLIREAAWTQGFVYETRLSDIYSSHAAGMGTRPA